jgi:hypothetical protein
MSVSWLILVKVGKYYDYTQSVYDCLITVLIR